jgi:diadenosine tetraphosphate (Ap4A) HIT family hydrolase
MNPTLQKFHYPDAVIRDYSHWAVLIRPWQWTLGCLVIVEKSDATGLGQLEPAAWTEFGDICRDAEEALRKAFQYDKINYVSLMLADPNVHFHVLPRYQALREFDGASFTDPSWPKPPDMTWLVPAEAGLFAALQQKLTDLWRRN